MPTKRSLKERAEALSVEMDTHVNMYTIRADGDGVSEDMETLTRREYIERFGREPSAFDYEVSHRGEE